MIRLSQWLSLIFFSTCTIGSCRQTAPGNIEITWKNNQAVELSVPVSMLPLKSAERLQVHLQGNSSQMLGSVREVDGMFIFQPLVAFTRGKHYDILNGGKRVATVKIPPDTSQKAPVLKAVYPSPDTLPMNMLKMYFHFSAAMHEGESLQHIFLLNGGNDTLAGTFLELQPELWNKEGTVLTLWLDPGRIKRDLIPNQKLGNPLRSGHWYTLVVTSNWKGLNGESLLQTFYKRFYAGGRDSISPHPQQWRLSTPAAATRDPLIIIFGEPLDYYLAMETIHVSDETNQPVPGEFSLQQHENAISFLPTNAWQTGNYHLGIDPVLEDLAGNNLQRLFERDIMKMEENSSKPLQERQFSIRAGSPSIH